MVVVDARDDGCFHITKETLTSGTTPAKLVPLRNITAGLLSTGVALDAASWELSAAA